MKHDTKSAAERLGIRPKTLENWRTLGRGPAYLKLGNRVVYDDADLEQFERASRRTSTAQQQSAA